MKINLLLITTFLSIVIYAGIEFETGIVGTTRLNNSDGCACHNINFNDSVNVWIEGPDSIFVGDTSSYKIYLSGGPALRGGFNVAAMFGMLESADSTSYVNFNELTHSFPLEFTGDTVYWNFNYIASDSMGIDTIYSTANSTNGDGNPQVGDKWNFGDNFPVTIIDEPVSVEDVRLVSGYHLAQNYPNPFNPSTKIRFTIPFGETGHALSVQLIVYDVLGNEIAILVNEQKPAGTYEVEFSATGRVSELTSGIYIYQLTVGNIKTTKKMLMIN